MKQEDEQRIIALLDQHNTLIERLASGVQNMCETYEIMNKKIERIERTLKLWEVR